MWRKPQGFTGEPGCRLFWWIVLPFIAVNNQIINFGYFSSERMCWVLLQEDFWKSYIAILCQASLDFQNLCCFVKLLFNEYEINDDLVLCINKSYMWCKLPKIIKQTFQRIHVVNFIISFSCKVASPLPSVSSRNFFLGNILTIKW